MAVSEASASRPPVAKPKATIIRANSPPQKETKAEKKAKRRQSEKPDISEGDSGGLEGKSKKRKRETEISVPENIEQEEESGKKSKKKSKRMKNIEPEATTSLDVAPKKKRRNKTGFLDPSEDASLSEQSKKCLSYVFLQFHRPSKWKFNKARQNWLIRNIWSEEMIPTVHLPLAFGYLAKVQGGTRENLLQSCRSVLEQPIIAVPLESTTSSPQKDTAAQPEATLPLQPTTLVAADSTKLTRAQTLINLFSSLNDVQPKET